ncbi:hypothetical protein [Christiangramia salexigens]|uniref:CHRD domain-containing protein n=1 Tax=Christiangramia salexigens TaxID=1913577 RepID=A0A1L3J196_9FLAO|nr:hypothetical protein [Christiangramia salexigens]APG58892.1 hypothetical protein LPB144_00045 [Christiangramia salexigens]
MKIIKGLFFSLALLGLTSCSDDDDVEVEEFDTYSAQLSQLNDSGVSGTAAISINDNVLSVVVEAQGMEPNMAHPQHIHGLSDSSKNATCPPASADTDERRYNYHS